MAFGCSIPPIQSPEAIPIITPQPEESGYWTKVLTNTFGLANCGRGIFAGNARSTRDALASFHHHRDCGGRLRRTACSREGDTCWPGWVVGGLRNPPPQPTVVPPARLPVNYFDILMALRRGLPYQTRRLLISRLKVRFFPRSPPNSHALDQPPPRQPL